MALVILRDALRGLRAGKGTTPLAFAILALAIAAGTMTFSVVDAIALRRLPFAAPERLVAIAVVNPNGVPAGNAAPQDYFRWKNRVDALETLGAYRQTVLLPVQVAGPPEHLAVARVTTNLFEVLGATPALGRLFGPEHDAPGSDGVVVLSHALWSRAFAADPAVIGRSLTMGTEVRTIIGVLPGNITYPVGPERATDAYIPSVAAADERLEATPIRTFNMQIIGRLRAGATIAQAQQQIDALNAARFGATSGGKRVHLVLPLHDRVVGPAKSWLLLVLAGVGCVLLVACVNVANLLLARATVRARELATREVLGASRGHIALTLMCEGLLLTVAAGAAGITLAYAGVDLASSMLPEGLARASTIGLDARVLVVSISVVLLCGLAFASAPVWLASRIDLFAATRSSSGAVIGGRRRTRSLGAFLVAEMAFVSALLVATTLVVTTFVLITTADLGFDRRNLMAFGVQKSFETVPKPGRAASGATFRADLLQRVRAIPGVTGAALIRSGVPLAGGSSSSYLFSIPGRNDGKTATIATREVTPEYFSTMNFRLVRGRWFEPSDGPGAPRVVVINDTAAARYFAGRDPVGQAVNSRGPATVIGVIFSVRMHGPEFELEPELYEPIDQVATASTNAVQLVVRTSGPAATLAPGIRETARAALGDGEIFQPRFIDDNFHRLTAGRRFNAGLMTIFGVVALVIGAIGIYGTMAFVVAQEVRAIGLRMALGATPARVRASVLKEAVARVVAGVVIGLTCAWAASSLFTSLVFGVLPTHPAIYASVAVMMAAVGVLAALVPALRASRLDPLVALRSE